MEKNLKRCTKDEMLQQGGYAVVPNVVMQRLVGVITSEGSDGGKALALYVYLLGYVDNRPALENGKPNPRFGYAYPTVDTIAKELKVSRNGVKPLCNVLESHGLMETKIEKQFSKTFKLYKPLYVVTE